MGGQLKKDQVVRTLDDAIYAFGRAIPQCNADQDFTGLSDAFPMIAKHLPILLQTLGSMQNYLGNTEETEEVKKKYNAVSQFAEMCRKQAGYFEDIFVAITADNSVPKLERYRNAVDDADGARIESVTRKLLDQAVDLAVAPLVSDDLIEELERAQEEVAALGPSLKDDHRVGATLNNYAGGVQFFHNGTGNQNHCSGGVQVTGDGATNHFAPEKKRE
ncbi:hypothetical protein F4776DRAFT_651636 [Hypoxylon sp. NC0597]|nr:hypothetical protein F4776DRAFT_651636 [Hypoxylon sp. NC0597]